MKIAVCVPWSSPFIWSRFAEAALDVRAPAGTELKWIFGKGWCPARRHTDAIEKGLEWGADLLMIFGADQLPEPDLVERLYAHVLQGRLPICAMVPSRGYFPNNTGSKPFQPLAWRWKPTPFVDGKFEPRIYRGQSADPDMIELIAKDGTTQIVHIIGSGCVMFHRDHILAMKRPWFQEAVDPITYKRYANMDTRFIWRLQDEGGCTAYVDTSIDIQHLTDMAIDNSFQDRFNDWMDPDAKCSEPEIILKAAKVL